MLGRYIEIMSKSILVIDTPKSCQECPLFKETLFDKFCCADNKNLISVSTTYLTVHNGCPLKLISDEVAEIVER